MNNERYVGKHEKKEQKERLTRDRLQAIGEKVERVFKKGPMEGYKLSPETQEYVMKHLVTENSSLRDAEGRYRTFGREDLEMADLEPKYGMVLEGVKMGFSEVFKIAGGREAVIGYVDTGNGWPIARSYYRSNSQGVWRYMPDRLQDKDGNVTWFGKGQSEEAVTLPSETQRFLNALTDSQERRMGKRTRKRAEELAARREWTFHGMARAVKTTGASYRHMRMNGMTQDSLSREVEARPRYAFGGHVPPERMMLPERFAPNFDSSAGEYKVKSGRYGEVKVQMFMSRDGALKWTMMEDRKGRAWVGQVETRSPITSTGCRAQWVSAGDFATPLYEYRTQDKGYGDSDDVKFDLRGQVQYVSMWKNYLSKVPLIRGFKASQNKRKESVA